MNFTKHAIAMAVLSATSLSSMAASVDIYGKANLTFQSSDEGDGSFTEVKSNASRIGFKGNHDLGNGLQVVYKAEFQVDMDGDSDKGDSITDRNQYVGLKGIFGEVLLGKNDTVLKQSQGKVDLFSDLNGDIKSLWKGENRLSDTMTFKSPKYSDIQLGVTYIAEGDVDGEDAVSTAISYGDMGLKKSKLYASVAYDSDVEGYDILRATVQGKVAGIKLGAMYQDQSPDNGVDADGFLVSASYDIDKITLKGQVQTLSYDGGDDKSGVTVGADYKLAKSTKLFAFYTTFDMDSAADEDYVALGLEYKF